MRAFLFGACISVLLPVLVVADAVPYPTEQTLRRMTTEIVGDEKAWEVIELLRWAPHASEAENVPIQAQRRNGITTIKFDSPCEPEDTYFLRSAQLVAAPFRIDKASCATGILATPPIFFRAEVYGVVRPAEERSIGADRVMLSVDRCLPHGQKDVAPFGGYPVHIAADGKWSATVPADCILATLSRARFTPIRFPAIALAAGQRKYLGEQRFVEGARLSARVVSVAEQPLSGVNVNVIASRSLADAVANVAKGEAVRPFEARKTDQAGWVHFDGLEAGRVYLHGGGYEYAPTFSEAIELAVGVETTAPSLTLTRFGSAVATLDKYFVGPETKRYRAWVLALPNVGSRWIDGGAIRADADSDGLTKFEKLWPGRWRFKAYVAGDFETSAVGIQDVDVAAGQPSYLQFSTIGHLFKGVVRRDDRPVKAILQLTPLVGVIGERSDTSSAADGSFDVFLANPGSYQVRVLETDGSLQAVVPEVLFSDENSVVNITVPSGEVHGIVIDRSETLIKDATVIARQTRSGKQSDKWMTIPVASGRTKADGSFDLRGLAAGTWEIVAKREDQSSAPQIVRVDGAGGIFVRLIVESSQDIVGRVVTKSGEPVPSASGFAWTESTRAGELPAPILFRTGPKGDFRLTLDRPTASIADVVVLPIRRPVVTARLRVSAEDQLITVPDVGGSVRLEIQRGNPLGGYQPVVLISEEGVVVGLDQLSSAIDTEWVSTPFSDVLLIPQMTPGTWRLARFESLQKAQEYFGKIESKLPFSFAFSVISGTESLVTLPPPAK